MIKFTRNDLLIDFLNYIEQAGEQCQEAKDYYDLLPADMTLGEAIDHIQVDSAFADNWVAYCYLTFPKLVDQEAYDGFILAANMHEGSRAYIEEVSSQRADGKALRGEEITSPNPRRDQTGKPINPGNPNG